MQHLTRMKMLSGLFYGMMVVLFLCQLEGCATAVTRFPTISKEEIRQEENVQLRMVSRKGA